MATDTVYPERSRSRFFRIPVRTILALLEIGLAVAIILIVYLHLSDYDVTQGTSPTNYQCLLGTSNTGYDLCIFTYVCTGIALLAALVLLLSVCMACKFWLHFDYVVDFLFSFIAMIVWLAAAITLTEYNTNKVQNETDAQKDWRNAVVVMSWVLFALFAIDAIMSLLRFLYRACGCCGGREAKKLREYEVEMKRKDEEILFLRRQLDSRGGIVGGPLDSPGGLPLHNAMKAHQPEAMLPRHTDLAHNDGAVDVRVINPNAEPQPDAYAHVQRANNGGPLGPGRV